MQRRLPTIEVIDDQTAAMWRGKSGAQRLQVATLMFRSARTFIFHAVRQAHPEWTDQQVHRETAKRISHGAC